MNQEAIDIFRAKGIIWGWENKWESGSDIPVREMILPKYEKRGNYHYVGGKRVSRNVAAFLARNGVLS